MDNMTLTGVMHTKRLLRSKTSAEFEMTRGLLARHKSTMYNGQKEKHGEEMINLNYASAILL